MEKSVHTALAAAAVALFANVAQASPVRLDWTTTIQSCGICRLSAGASVTMTVVFDVAADQATNQ